MVEGGLHIGGENKECLIVTITGMIITHRHSDNELFSILVGIIATTASVVVFVIVIVTGNRKYFPKVSYSPPPPPPPPFKCMNKSLGIAVSVQPLDDEVLKR